MEYKGAILAISKITPINNTKKTKRRKEVVFMKFFIDTAIVEEIKKTNVALIFNANQALLAARAGASYVSPFLVRLDDISVPGMDLIRTIVTIFHNYNIQTEIIAASIRNPIHVIDCALAGADIATVPYSVLEQMTRHPLTDAGIEKFIADSMK